MFPVPALTFGNLWFYFCISDWAQYDWFASFLFSNAEYNYLSKGIMKCGVFTLLADLSIDSLEHICYSPQVSFIPHNLSDRRIWCWHLCIFMLGLQGQRRYYLWGWSVIPDPHGDTTCEHVPISWSLNLDVSHTSGFVWHIAVELWDPKPLQTDSLYTMSLYQMPTHNLDYWGLAMVAKTVSGPPQLENGCWNCMETIPSIWNWISVWANICVSLV